MESSEVRIEILRGAQTMPAQSDCSSESPALHPLAWPAVAGPAITTVATGRARPLIY